MNRTLYKIISANIVSFLFMISSNAKLNVPLPDCPSKSERLYIPTEVSPLWIACKDSKNLYQGLLIQLSSQQEIIRIASVTDSLRNGTEIRFGISGTLEERQYKSGHLDGYSYIYKTDSVLGRILPKAIDVNTWNHFVYPDQSSILKKWLNQSPEYVITFESGRMKALKSGKLDYQFKIGADGRIQALNHPEMKNLFFVDSEPLMALDARDLKMALQPGFGSCKKYAAPLMRFVRHYDSLHFRRETSEKKHTDRLNEIKNRFYSLCIPADIRNHWGKLECPPALPNLKPTRFCDLSFSDQLRIPYQPKYFKFERTLKISPENFVAKIKTNGLDAWMSQPSEDKLDLLINQSRVSLKQTGRGIFFRTADGALDLKNWWEWSPLPNH